VDGNYIQPLPVDYVDCGNGERFDVLLEANAPAADGGLYWATAQSRYRALTVAGAARIIYKDVAAEATEDEIKEGYPDLIPASNVSALIEAAPKSAGNDSTIAAQVSFFSNNFLYADV
jgi:hypothetical protein